MMKSTAHRRIRKYLFIGGIVATVLFALFFSKTDVSMAGNESTRFAVIRAVAEQNSWAIDGQVFRSVDRVVLDGKVYSDKPPMLSTLIGGAVKVPHTLLGLNFEQNYGLLIYLVNAIFFGGINVLIFLLFFRKLMPMRGSIYLKGLFAFSLVFGSWLLTYSVTVNNHTPGALLLWVWFLLLDEFGRTRDIRRAAWAGLAAGFAATIDIPLGVILGAAGLFAVAGRKALLHYCAGGAAMVLAGLALNWISSGTPVPLYLAGTTATFSPGWSCKAYGQYAWDTLFGGRGLFSYQPLALFGLAAAFSWKQLRPAERALFGAAVATTAFYIINTNEYGGWAYGFRYLIPVIPAFWYFSARFLLPRLRRVRFGSALLTILAIWGVITALAGVYAPFCVSYEGLERSPQGTVCYNIRASFPSNLLALSFEQNPGGSIPQALIRHYGPAVAIRYLHTSYVNTKNLSALAILDTYVNAKYPRNAR